MTINVYPGDAVKVIGGSFSGKTGKFCFWPKSGRLSAWVTFDDDESKKQHCIRCTSITFVPSVAAARSKRSRRESPPRTMEQIDGPPTEQEKSNDEEVNLTKEDIRAVMTAFAEMNVAIREVSDRVGKIEFKESG